MTVSETFRLGSVLVRSVSFYSCLPCLLARASSLMSLVRSHSFLGLYMLGLTGMKSLIGRPNITCAGLMPVSLSRVLRWVRRALLKVSVSRLPVLVTFSLSILLALFTPSSALLGVWEVG